MWVSEVKTKKGRKLGSFHHRKSFMTMDEGLEWALDEYGREKGDTEWAHDVLKTICHELVHVSDYISGKLSWRSVGLLWKGLSYPSETMADYFKLPYEIRAYGMEKGLLVSFLDFWKECEANVSELKNL